MQTVWISMTPGNFAFHPDPSCLTLKPFSQTLSNIEALRKLKQTGNLADDYLLEDLRVKYMNIQTDLD